MIEFRFVCSGAVLNDAAIDDSEIADDSAMKCFVQCALLQNSSGILRILCNVHYCTM